jgi:hypothetical protein
MVFRMIFAAEVYDDLQHNIDWYNSKQPGLGKRFYQSVKIQFSRIKKTPFSIAIRYEDVRCATVKGFPFMIHFKIDPNSASIKVLAVFSTQRDPEVPKNRGGE